MKEIQYKDFSLRIHKKNWQLKKPNICHLELTFKCNFNCNYCYTSCYNKPAFLKRELPAGEFKKILDKLYNAGILWLYFTGGDVFTRKDFFEIYGYAKKKGFIIMVLTNAALINDNVAAQFKDSPPFEIYVTLNSVRKDTFERISGVEGSFHKVMQAINLLSKHKINFKLSTMITRDNVSELPEIKIFVEGLGKKIRPTSHILPRLNGDKTPCSLRISPSEAMEVNRKLNLPQPFPEACFDKRPPDESFANPSIFHCGAGSEDQVCINPYGEMFPCLAYRFPPVDILNSSIEGCLHEFSFISKSSYKTQSECKSCSLWQSCFSCPGKAYLETGDLEAPVEWFCELTHLAAGKKSEVKVAYS